MLPVNISNIPHQMCQIFLNFTVFEENLQNHALLKQNILTGIFVDIVGVVL